MLEKVYFMVGITYEDVTPESVEYGDYDAAGWEVEPCEYSLRELHDLITDRQYLWERNDDHSWYTNPEVVSYEEMRERSYGLHVKVPNERSERFYKKLMEVIYG